MQKYVVGIVISMIGMIECVGLTRAMDDALGPQAFIVAKRAHHRPKRKFSGPVRVRSHAIRDNGLTHLHCAVREGRIEDVQRLIKCNAHPDRQTACGFSALHYAVLGDESDGVVEILLCNGARSEVKNKKGRTPLHLAVSLGKEEAIRSLLAHGANINVQDNFGNTVLHDSAEQNKRNRVGLMQLLLQCGADDLVENRNGQTPLEVAQEMGNSAAVRVLRDHQRKQKESCVVS